MSSTEELLSRVAFWGRENRFAMVIIGGNTIPPSPHHAKATPSIYCLFISTLLIYDISSFMVPHFSAPSVLPDVCPVHRIRGGLHGVRYAGAGALEPAAQNRKSLGLIMY